MLALGTVKENREIDEINLHYQFMYFFSYNMWVYVVGERVAGRKPNQRKLVPKKEVELHHPGVAVGFSNIPLDPTSS